MPKYKKCPDCGGMAKYDEKKEAHVCKSCGKSYPADHDEKAEYQRQYPKPGKY